MPRVLGEAKSAMFCEVPEIEVLNTARPMAPEAVVWRLKSCPYLMVSGNTLPPSFPVNVTCHRRRRSKWGERLPRLTLACLAHSPYECIRWLAAHTECINSLFLDVG